MTYIDLTREASYQNLFLRKSKATCDFPGGGADPLLPMDSSMYFELRIGSLEILSEIPDNHIFRQIVLLPL